jgi:hypothetical protein
MTGHFALTFEAPGFLPLVGSSRSGELFRINTATGTGTPIGTVADGSTEIEFNPSTGRAWMQQIDGAFTIREFDILTATPIGGTVGTGASFNGLEYVGGTLYGPRPVMFQFSANPTVTPRARRS